MRVAGHGALVQLRAFIARSELKPNDRLPPERRLCEMIGVTRTELRKACAILEAEGAISRHVGRGTFLGDGRADHAGHDAAAIAKRTSPQEVMRARYLLEPMLAQEAALHATQEQIDALAEINRAARRAGTWREYETLDNRFHRHIAESSQNLPLLTLFDQLNALRRTVVWGRMRPQYSEPPADHHSFAEHERILDAIADRDSDSARRGMQAHIATVTARLFRSDG